LLTVNPLVKTNGKIPHLAMVYFLFFLTCLGLGIYLENVIITAIPFLIFGVILAFFRFDLLYYILIISIPLSITVDFSKSLSTDFPTEFLSIGLTVIFWIYWLINRPKELSPIWNSKIFWILILMLGWSGFTTIFAVNKLIALKYCLAKTWYITSYIVFTFWIVKDLDALKKLFWMIFLPTTITVIYSFVRTYLGGFSFEDTNQYSLPFFDNHVTYATTMSIVLPWIFWARCWYPKGSVLKWLLTISIPFYLIAIYFSYTRACYLALIVGVAVIILLYYRKLVITYCLVVAMAISILFYFSDQYFYLRLAPDYNTTVMHDEFKDHLISTFYGKDVSSMERLNMWVSVFRMYQKRPIVGYGPNNFPSNYKPYGVLYFKTWVSDNPLNLSCHNYFWLLLAEQGVIGSLMFVFFIGFLLFSCQKLYSDSKDESSKQIAKIIAATFGIFCVILFFNDMVETSKNGSLFFINIAILIRLMSKSNSSLND
jgi:O-antigen ligase